MKIHQFHGTCSTGIGYKAKWLTEVFFERLALAKLFLVIVIGLFQYSETFGWGVVQISPWNAGYLMCVGSLFMQKVS